ncbi:MAG: histidine phosphatase family protein [Nitrospirota bacterium]
MVTTLYLIRHGETEGAEVRRYKGSIDVPLSKHGIRQMRQIARYLEKFIPPIPPSILRGEGKEGGKNHSNKLSAVYCSDLSRSIKSAEIITEHNGPVPIVMPDLRERNFGIWEGMSFDEIKERYSKEFGSWANNPLKYSPMGGESTLEVRDRVVIALNMILENHKNNPPSPPFSKGGMGGFSGKNIAIVAHGGVNRIIICHLLGIPLENIFRIEQDYAAVNIIEFWDKYPVVKLINYRTLISEHR